MVFVGTGASGDIIIGVPAYSEIMNEIEGIEKIAANVKTVEQAILAEQEYRNEIGCVEINGMSTEEYAQKNEAVEWIRYEKYGNTLEYIYDEQKDNLRLDVKCKGEEEMPFYIVRDCYKSDFTEGFYNDCIRQIKELDFADKGKKCIEYADIDYSEVVNENGEINDFGKKLIEDAKAEISKTEKAKSHKDIER